MKYHIPTIEKFSWQTPVISQLDTPPISPSKGNRYLIGSGTDDWSGQDKNIAWYDGSDWNFIISISGMMIYDLNEEKYFYYNGISWTDTSSLVDLSGKEDVGVAQGIMDTHELAYDHSLIATALQDLSGLTTDNLTEGSTNKYFTWDYDYGDLINTPTIPTDTGDLTNGAGFITGISSDDVTTALGYTPLQSSDLTGYATETWVGEQGFVTGTPWTSEGYITDLSGFTLDDLADGITYGRPTLTEISNWNALVSFPGFTDLSTDYGFTDNSADWDTAYGWGDHSQQGYLTSITGQSIGDLSDVNDTGKDTGKVLKYNAISGDWEIGDDNDTTYTASDFDIKDLTDSTDLMTVWSGKQDALGFTPEDVANKRTSFQATPDDTAYPSEKLVKDSLDLKSPLSSPTFTGVVTIPNTGLHLLDTNASHDLIIKPGSDLSADRTLTLTTGNTDMIVDFTAVTDEYVLAYDVGTNTWRGVAGGAGGGATTALDNLASVAINTSLISDTDSTDDLGSSTKYWKDSYIDSGIFSEDLQVGAGTVMGSVPIYINQLKTGFEDISISDVSLSSRNFSLIIEASGSKAGDNAVRPGIVQFCSRTDTSGLAFNLQKLYTGKDDVYTSTRGGSFGAFANNGGDTFSYIYMGVNSRQAYNGHVFKIGEYGLEINPNSASTPTSTLDVVQPTAGIGTVTITTNTTCTGTGTQFTNTFRVGDSIIITATSETRAITAITSDTVMTIASATNTTNSAYTRSGGSIMKVKGFGSTGFGINPTAIVHIKAGTATAGTAPLKLTSGTNLTTPEAGALEYDGYNLYHTPVSTRNTVLTTGRVSSEASSATPTINTDRVDAHSITALATAITSMTTNLSGTPTNFQKLIIRIKDNGAARAIAWGASFEAKGVALPTTTVISKVLTVGFIYDSVTSKWGCVASNQEV